MKKFLFILLLVVFVSCSSDDDKDCITCKVSGISFGEACKGENGNAFLEGEDTGVAFEEYAEVIEASVEDSSCN